jgi:hypothetical protein
LMSCDDLDARLVCEAHLGPGSKPRPNSVILAERIPTRQNEATSRRCG